MPNAKQISVNTIKATYDLALAYFEANTDLITGDETPAEHVLTNMGMKLAEMRYQRAASLGAVIKSHEAKLKRDGGARANAADADDVVAALYKEVTGAELGRPTAAAPAAAEDAASEEETPAASDEATPAADAAPQVARVATSFTVADGTDALMNPMVATVSNKQVSTIGDLLAALDAAEGARDQSQKLQAAYAEVIAAYQSGADEVDESALVEPAKFDVSGFAGAPKTGDLVPVLDNMISQHVTPATSWGDLISRLEDAERAVAEGAGAVKSLKRDLRRAKPKDRVKVEAGASASAAAHADSLAEIDEINADCEAVMEVASDLFPKCYGENAQVLGFEVPKLDFGTAHPEVPTIDPSFRFYTKVLVEALSAIADNEIIWLHGESGCGKSEFWAQVAAHLNMPFTRINLDGHLTRSDIVGGMKLVSDGKGGQETRFVEGALPRAMARPGLLLIDEFDLGDPEIMPIFQPVLEGKPLVLLEDGGRIVRPHPLFRIALTGNTIGLGSDNQMYLNVFEQSAATRDRISAFVEMQYMPPNVEQEVVMARMPDADEDFVGKLIQLANKVREGYRNQEIHQLFSTRAVQYCARRFTRLAPLYPTPEQAAQEILETVILNRMDGASRQVVKGLQDNIF